MAAGMMFLRWPDAAGILGVDTRKVLDLIAAGELEPVRRPDDLYVRARSGEALMTRGVSILLLQSS